MFCKEEYEFLLHEIKNYICLINNSMQLISKQHPEVLEYSYWKDTADDISHLSQMCREFSATGIHCIIHKKSIQPEVFFSQLQHSANGVLAQGTHFSLELPANLPELHLDPDQMMHALINLIKNAAEAISPDGHVLLSVTEQDSFLQIKIQDDGCGISPAQLDKIFLPAYTSKSYGTGLGLTITKQIMEAHNGSIRCQSNPGQGTVFILMLPL